VESKETIKHPKTKTKKVEEPKQQIMPMPMSIPEARSQKPEARSQKPKVGK
tara:strand:+ start:295 stop:447 length:153 start_codon:yes stop_codon:yes gene_type:complete